MIKDLCYTCRHRIERDCNAQKVLVEGFPGEVIKCGQYKTIAFIEDVDDGGGTYRCSFCGQLITSWTEKCPKCGAEYGR